MNRKIVAVLALLSLAFLASCRTSREAQLERELTDAHAEASSLQDQLDGVRSKLENIESAVEDLRNNVDDLTSAVDEFDVSRWQASMDDIDATAADVDEAAIKVEAAVAKANDVMKTRRRAACKSSICTPLNATPLRTRHILRHAARFRSES